MSMICDRPMVCESRGLWRRMVTTDTISWRRSWILIVVRPLVETGAQRGTMLAWLRSRLPSTVTAAGQAEHSNVTSLTISWPIYTQLSVLASYIITLEVLSQPPSWTVIPSGEYKKTWCSCLLLMVLNPGYWIMIQNPKKSGSLPKSYYFCHGA